MPNMHATNTLYYFIKREINAGGRGFYYFVNFVFVNKFELAKSHTFVFTVVLSKKDLDIIQKIKKLLLCTKKRYCGNAYNVVRVTQNQTPFIFDFCYIFKQIILAVPSIKKTHRYTHKAKLHQII